MKRRQKTIRGRVSLRKSGIRKASLRSISVFLAAEVSFFSPHAGAADIVIDTALSGGGTSLDSAPNGVPVLNLARPDGHGVSHNCFSSYNVGAEGLILNNSTATGLSVLGGALCGNPNYQGRAAVLVINEVAGGRGSRLSGYTEIFGPAADFILANPNGISCNGAGFINTPRVTLSTGAPVFRSGAFQGLDVRGGAVIIEGDGLDAGAAGYFSIISRMALLKGPLWGRDVSIITGTGIFGNDGAFLVEKDSDGKPGFAVDATALGGIYAGRIKILCNERGAGVRSGADWLADASEIEIRSDGTVVLANVQAMEDISVVSSSGDIRQNGVAIALENLYYSAGEIINRGVIDAEKDLVLAGSLDNDFALIASKGNILIEGRGELKNRSGRILLGDTGSGSLVIRGIDSIRGGGGSIVSSGGFDLVMAGDAVLSEETGSLRADGFLRLRAENIVNSSDLEMRGDIILEGRGALILRAGSRLVTDRGIILSAGEDISNSGTISGAGITARAGRLVNRGDITAGSEGLFITVAGELINYGRLSGAGDMVLRSSFVTNSDALSSEGIFPEISSGSLLDVKADGITNSGGFIFAGAGMMIETEKLSNASTGITEETMTGNACVYSRGALEIKAPEGAASEINNYSAYVESAGDMDIDLGPDGSLVNTGADLGTYSRTWTHVGGFGSDWAPVNMDIITSGDMRTLPSHLSSGEDLTIRAGNILNHGSLISAGSILLIDAGTLVNENNVAEVLQTVEEGKRTTHRDRIDLGFGKITYRTYHTNDTRLRYYTLDVSSNTPGTIGADMINIRAESLGNGTTREGGPGGVATDRTGNVTNTVPGNDAGVPGSIDLSSYVERGEKGEAMFSINRDPGHNYLMETRSRFVDVGALYGSRYFFERIGYDRSSEVKVLGDAFYEERLVMRAILQATCEKYLGEGIKSDQEEMKYLLDNAVEASRDLNLSVGVALTKEQIEALREPIIWYVERQVCGVTALAPVIYIPENILAALPSGGAPKLAGDRVDIKTAREVLNNGLLHGGASLSISAGSIGNISVKGDDEAEIGGGTVFLLSQGDILNSAAIIRSEKSLTAMAGNDFASMGGGVGSAGDAVLSAGGDINFGTAKTKTVKHESRYGTGGVSSTTISRGSTLTVAGDLTMSSGRDINFVGSSADVTGNADLKTAGSFNLMNDYDTESYSGTRARHGNFSNSRTTVTSYDKTVVSSSFSTGGNLSVDSGNDVNILGSSINTGGDYSIRAEGTQKIIAAHDEHYFQKETKKSGFGSGGSIYGSEKRGDMTKDTIVGGSALEIRGKYASQSGKDTNITGSGIIAGDTVDITTGGSLNITADYDTHDEEHGITKGRTMSGATFYSKELDLAGSGYNETAGSQITAGGKLTVKIAGDLSVEGSEIRADSAVIDVRGNFTETGARSISYDYHVHEKTKVTQNMKELAVLSLTGGCSIYKDLRLSKKGKLTLGGGVTCENGRMSVNVAKVEYKKSETRTDSASQTSSSLKFTNCYEINTGKDFTLAASEIKSDVDGSVTAGGDVYIIATEETSSTTSKVTRGTADLSAGVKHASSDVYYAAREVAEATKALAEAKKDYDNFRDNLRKAEDDRQRGLISDEEYRSLESERKYFEANIAILTENVVAKTANLVSAGKGAAGSIASGALGFSADGRLDLSGSITTSGSSSITHVGSRLTACGNLTIKSADRAMIEGSDVSAAGDLTLEAKNIEITASMDSTESGSRTTGGQISFNWSSSGSGSDSLNIFGANLSASGSEDRYSAASYNNAHLKGGNISIKSADDITVRGATVAATERLSMNVGGNLTVESLQSTESASSRSYGLSGTFSSSEKGLKDNKTKSRDGSGGGSFNISRTESRWVNHQTALTGGTVDVYVEKRTTLAGAVIASDTEDLKLSTGSFEYSDIKDRKISWNYGGGGSLGTDLNSGNRKNERNNSFSLNAEYGFSDKRQTNFATIGNGEITVRGAPAPLVADGDIFLPGLNRKVPMAQYGIVDAGLKGQMLVDMSTVEMTGSPVKTLSDTGKAISQGWDAASNSIGEIWKESRVLYQKTNNYIDYNHFSTDNDAELYLDSKYILVKSKEFLLERLGFDPEENFNLFKDRILSDRLEYYSYKLVLGEKFLENEMKDFDYIGRTYLSGIKIDPESNFMEYNKAIFQFPMSGKGFVNSANLKYNPEIHKYGTYGTIMTLANAMEKWSATGNYPMLINDLDLLNEAPSSLHHNVPHRGVDINLSGTDGSFVSNCHSSIYSHETTKLQIQTIIENVPYNYEITRILFNDDKIIENFLDRKNSNNKQIIRKAIGHDNHYHLEVRSAKQKLPK